MLSLFKGIREHSWSSVTVCPFVCRHSAFPYHRLWTNAMPTEVNRSLSVGISEQRIRPFKKTEPEFTRVKQSAEPNLSEAGIVTCVRTAAGTLLLYSTAAK